MPVPSAITDLSTTASANSPSGSEAVFPSLDDYLRAAYAFIAQNYASLGGKQASLGFTPVNKAGDTMTGALTVNSTITATGNISTSGSVTASGNVTAYSDARLKSNVQTIGGALEIVRALRGVRYTKDGEQGVGVIAQEVQRVVPEVVTDGEYLSVAYGNLVGVLIEAVKELADRIER